MTLPKHENLAFVFVFVCLGVVPRSASTPYMCALSLQMAAASVAGVPLQPPIFVQASTPSSLSQSLSRFLSPSLATSSVLAQPGGAQAEALRQFAAPMLAYACRCSRAPPAAIMMMMNATTKLAHTQLSQHQFHQ
eukprot:1136006-Rhodomonas_salina.1